MKRFGEYMNFSVISIFMISAFFLFSVKHLQECCESGTFEKRLEQLAKNALRITFIGIAAVGVFYLALLFFPLTRTIGFAIIPSGAIIWVRGLFKAIFDTESVYVTLQILVNLALSAAGWSLIFSVFGFVYVKMFFIFRVLRKLLIERNTEQGRCSETAIPRAFKKIFLNFANLRI